MVQKKYACCKVNNNEQRIAGTVVVVFRKYGYKKPEDICCRLGAITTKI
jgi:hypothetical protein